MSTKSPSPILAAALANVPGAFRSRLIHTYLDLKKNCVEARYWAAGLAAGKFCEVVLRFLQEKVHGSFTPFGTKINNYADECRKLVNAPSTAGNESERIVLPRGLVFLYTMLNKRGIGHVGGDVDANPIDIAAMAKTADWIVCELIRINHGLSLEEAQDIVDGISVRQLPTIWEVAGKKRVLKEGLRARDQALLLLYSNQNSAVLLEDLCEWIEYSNLRSFKSLVIGELHKQRFLEFDKDSESIVLSPKGVEYVERVLIAIPTAGSGSPTKRGSG
jgi:hypothetical protein